MGIKNACGSIKAAKGVLTSRCGVFDLIRRLRGVNRSYV